MNNEEIKIGDLVLIRYGTYKNCCANVIEINEYRKVKIRLIGYNNKRGRPIEKYYDESTLKKRM
jgi:ribosomal protein L24